MAEDKKGFILYADMRGNFDKLPNEKAGELIKHIFSYVNDESPEPVDLIIDIAFEPIKNQLKRDLKKWESIREKRSLAGKASANKRQQEATKTTHVESVEQKPTNPTVIVNDTVKVTVKVNDIIKREEDFKNKVFTYKDKYSDDLLNDFFNYWSQHGEKDKKMMFEKEKSFEIKKRLLTWKRNEKRFKSSEENKGNNAGSKSTDIPTGDCSTEWSK